jgi:heavy metal translocating P-type ATPase
MRRSRGLLLRIGLAAFFSANVMVLSLFLYSMEDAPPIALALVRGLLLCFSVPVFVILAPPYAAGFVRDMKNHRFSMDSLIAIGAGTAFAVSCVSVFAGGGREYFDTATMVLLLVTTGRLLEANARVKSRRALTELLELRPPQARVRRDGEWVMDNAASVATGERVQVWTGERVPSDGAIVSGAGSLDESMLTGEPLPASRVVGDTVRAGTVCVDGLIEIEASGGPQLIDRIAASIEEAQRIRSPLERLADRAAALFVPFTLSLAAAVTLLWLRSDPEKAWLSGLSVLVVACPCALGIAVPMANVLALGTAARRGILIRSAEALERLAGVYTIVLDKTGTVTHGRIEVKGILPAKGLDEQSVLETAAAAAARSVHPVSRAIVEAARARGIAVEEPVRVENLPGLGVAAELADGRRVLLGQPRWIAAQTGSAPPECEPDSENGCDWCASEGTVIGAILFHDPVAPEAVEAVAACQRLGYQTALLSGDRKPAVASAAARLGIPEFAAGLMPEEKAAWVRARRGTAMVGDGINDAPALASSEAGIAVAGGTGVAREVAEVVFLEPDLRRLPEVLGIALRARRIARQNLAWTFAYNASALTLASAGMLQPIWAAATMLMSSIVVIGNSLRLGRAQIPDTAA